MTLLAFFLAVVVVVLLAIAKRQGMISDPVGYFVDTTKAFFIGMGNMVVALFRKISGR